MGSTSSYVISRRTIKAISSSLFKFPNRISEAQNEMKYRLKFRVSGLTPQDGKNIRKFSINMEEGQSFVLGKFIPGVQHSIAILSIRKGVLYASRKHESRELEEPIRLNEVEGTSFQIKTGDLLRSGNHTVEFLEIPQPRQVGNTNTQFIDIVETPPFVNTQSVTAPVKGSESQSISQMSEPPSRAGKGPQVLTPSAASARFRKPLRRFAKIQLPQIPQGNILTSLALILFSSTLLGPLGDLGTPLTSGFLGFLLIPFLAYLLWRIQGFTQASASYSKYLRFLAIGGLLLLPCSYGLRISSLVALGSLGLLGAALFVTFVFFLKAEPLRGFVVTALLTGLPVLFVLTTSHDLSTPGTERIALQSGESSTSLRSPAATAPHPSPSSPAPRPSPEPPPRSP